jgi:hypothetical protein
MDIQIAILVILTLCVVGMAGILVVLIFLARQWKHLIKIVEGKVMNK